MINTIKFIFLFLFMLSVANADNSDLVNDIKFDGLQRISIDTVLNYSDLDIGIKYTDEISNIAIKKLYDTQLFSDVSITYNENILTIKVKENPTINLVLFEGNKSKKDDDLISEIRLTERSVFSRSKVKEDVKRLLELYQRSGRLSAVINPSVELLDNNRVNLIFEIDESEVLKVSKISIIGNNEFTDSDIRSVMTTKRSSLLKFWTSANKYDPDRIEYDKELITSFYNKNGYVNFAFTSSIAQLVNNKNNFEIIFTVSEGQRFEFGNVNVTSKLKKLDTEIVKNSISVKKGNIFNSQEVKDSVEYIKNSASTFGFTFIDITPDLNINNDDKTVDVMFDIDEGPKVYISRININGNTRTIDKVIRREFNFSEGDAYNKYSINYAKDKVKALNYFSKVDVTEERVSDTDRLNLNIMVEEKNTGSASLGAGYGDSNGSSLTVGLTEDNFLGKGQKTKIQASFAETQTLYDISFTEPRFNNKDLSVRTDLYSKFNDYSNASYETTTLGFGLALSFPLSSNNRITTKYSLLSTKTTADSNASAYETLLAGTNTVSIAGYMLSIDKRNSPYKPTNGSIFKIEQNLAGIGGTSNYLQNKITFKQYKKLSKKLTGAIKSEVGSINGYNTKNAPIDSLYNIGGKTLRGFQYGKVGPMYGTSSYTGGTYYYLITTETNFDLPIEEYDISSSLFLDLGSVWGLDDRFGSINDEHKLRASIGINFNWDSTIGPINFVFAEPFMSESTDGTDKFSFDIGYNF